MIERRRALRASALAMAMTLALAAPATASHHKEGEAKTGPVQAQATKIIQISPLDHVMLTGGKRTHHAEICNEDATGCKPAKKGRWSMDPKGIVKLSKKKGAQSTIEGIADGVATVTVTQGGVTGSTTITINEPVVRPTATPPPATHIVAVPPHPWVVEGQPYVIAFYECPRDVTVEGVLAEQASGRYGLVQNDGEGLSPAEEWVLSVSLGNVLEAAGCLPAEPEEVDPDEGFEEVYRRGNQVLMYKEDGAQGFSVRFRFADGTTVFPSDKAAYFGAALEPLPGLEGEEVEAALLDQFDVDGDGALTVGDIFEFEDLDLDALVDRYEAERGRGELTEAERQELNATIDIDGDGNPGTAEDQTLLEETVGGLLLDKLMAETPVEC